jgi:hypothetical protein
VVYRKRGNKYYIRRNRGGPVEYIFDTLREAKVRILGIIFHRSAEEFKPE